MITPRLLRLRDAPTYLGMNINYFNSVVRPHLPTIRIGKQGIAFDRVDLDAFVEQHKHRNGLLRQQNGGSLWDAEDSPDSLNGEMSGTLKSKFLVKEFENLQGRILGKKPKFI